MKINKDTLIESVAESLKSEFTIEDIKISTEILFDEIKCALKNGDRIEIRGFGSFSQRSRIVPKDPRENKTSTCERVKCKTVYFRMSKNMNDKLNGK